LAARMSRVGRMLALAVVWGGCGSGSAPAPVGSGAMPHLKPAFDMSEAREIWLMVMAEPPEK